MSGNKGVNRFQFAVECTGTQTRTPNLRNTLHVTVHTKKNSLCHTIHVGRPNPWIMVPHAGKDHISCLRIIENNGRPIINVSIGIVLLHAANRALKYFTH